MTQAEMSSPVGWRRSWARVVATLGVVALLLVGLAAVAAAKDKVAESDQSFDRAVTYDVTANVGAGPQEVELLVVGDVTMTAQCEAVASETPGYPYGIGIQGAWSVTNTGANPVAFVFESGATQETVWLTSEDPSFGAAGELVNETTGPGVASLQSFAILDHGGTSATGLWASSARVNPGEAVEGDEFGECVFTIQAEG